jgi:hypothetical protein
LRQGDIVAAQPNSTAWNDPWKRFGIVLSADCDLAQNKTGPNLICLPIIDHSTFLRDIWLPDETSRLKSRLQDTIETRLAQFETKLKLRHIDRWGESGGRDTITSEIQGSLSVSRKETVVARDIGEIADCWERIKKLRNSTISDANVALSTSLAPIIESHRYFDKSSKSDNDIGRWLLERALGSLQDRSDTWLIKELIGLDPDMMSDTQHGFVVPLRSISSMPVESVTLDRITWYKQRDHYLRVCRLRGIYKADLVQSFANLFMRVGLEDYRKKEHERLFKRYAERLFPVEAK